MTRPSCSWMLALLLVPIAAYGDTEPAPRAEKGVYDTLEVARFEVNREDYSTKEAERAGKIPEETLDHLHRALLGELTRAEVLPTVRKAAEAEGSSARALLLAGRVTDFKAGSRVARYFASMGVGAQKVEVASFVKRTLGEPGRGDRVSQEPEKGQEATPESEED